MASPVHLLKPNCNRGEYVAFLGTHLSGEAARPGHSNHPTLADERFTTELSLLERPPFRKCVQVVRKPAEWPTKIDRNQTTHLGAE
jgi:hypothetical protein